MVETEDSKTVKFVGFRKSIDIEEGTPYDEEKIEEKLNEKCMFRKVKIEYTDNADLRTGENSQNIQTITLME